VPPDCKIIIDRIKVCKTPLELFTALSGIENWTFGKCELYHWIEVLDLFDSYLEQASQRVEGSSWALALDNLPENEILRNCVTYILNFTTLLIEHSFSRHLYNSIDHLTILLSSTCMRMVLDVLQVLFMFSKRSNFLTRLSEERREGLLERLSYLADSWGGKEAGFGLAACCKDLPITSYPDSAKSVHMEFPNPYLTDQTTKGKGDLMTVLHIEDVTTLGDNPAQVMDRVIERFGVPEDKKILLYTHIRLAFNFPSYPKRCQCAQARLQALSILIYANALQDNYQQLLYSGLMEEIVDLLELEDPRLTDIKAAALRALTSIIHLDRAQNFPSIIDVTGAGSYHGFLPMMVRNCITSLTAPETPGVESSKYPIALATALFSFLYHLASYELGGEALVGCGMLESLLKVVQWKARDVDQITFVTRAVRVIDLITNMDMQAFQTHAGLTTFINRLESEVADCRKEQPYEYIPESTLYARGEALTEEHQVDGDIEGTEDRSTGAAEPMNINSVTDVPMDTDSNQQMEENVPGSSSASSLATSCGSGTNIVPSQVCITQRAALLKSMLNFLKKVIQDPAFSDSIRHIMETTLPDSLKHIISNAEYYGSSLFLLATDVVTVYVFQEPSLLSTLQDNGITDVVQQAILGKDIPPTREVISSIPNVFSALCLNSRGLNCFIQHKPFHKIFRVLISAEYLPAMRRRRTAEPMGDTASNLGNAMDELMRHQPSLKTEATSAIVKLLEDLCEMGQDSRTSSWKQNSNQSTLQTPGPMNTSRSGTSEGGSSEEEDDDDEPSTASHSHTPAAASGSRESNIDVANAAGTEEKPPAPLVDYIFNVMKFVDAILSNNSTDDHCREFVTQRGLEPLMKVLSLPNLPIDFPNTTSCQAVSSVCKSILNLAHENKVLQEGMKCLESVLTRLTKLSVEVEAPGSSVLLHELAGSGLDLEVEAVNPHDTPILNAMTAAHSYVMMFIHVCRTGQPDIRNMSIDEWGSERGILVLQNLAQLYLNLVWESTVLLAICSGEYQAVDDGFAKKDLDILVPLVPHDSKMSAFESNFRPGYPIQWMDVDDSSPSSKSSPTQTSSAAAKQERTSGAVLQLYARLIKPILSASSRLGRALAELFGLLVKLSVGSPLRQRRGHQLPTVPAFISAEAQKVASVLSELLTHGLRWDPKPGSPVPKLTFSICAVGFASPLLFDEKRFPYHLMLKKFIDCDGLKALFDVFYWAISDKNHIKTEGGGEQGPSLTEQEVEFLDSWLVLVERFVSPKAILETPHVLPARPSPVSRYLKFNSSAFLAHIHKLAFQAIQYLWKSKPIKQIGSRASDLMLAILCNILRHKEETELAAKPSVSSSATPSSSVLRPGPPDMELDDDIYDTRVSAWRAYQARNNRILLPTRPAALIDPALSPTRGTAPPVAANDIPDTESTEAEASSSTPSVPNNTDAVTLNLEGDEEQANPPPVETPAPEPDEPAAGSSNGAAATTINAVDSTNGNNATDDAAAAANRTRAETAAAALGIDLNNLLQLTDMGFSLSLCIEALVATSNIHQATDYLLNHSGGTGNVASSVRQVRRRTIRPGHEHNPMDWDYHEEEILRAIAMSLSDSSEKVTNKTSDAETEEKGLEALTSEEIDQFTETIFEKSLEIIDQVPECVYRVCDLLVTVGNRKGGEWMEKMMCTLVGQIVSDINSLLEEALSVTGEELVKKLAVDKAAEILCIRVHLFSLMFEEVKAACSQLLEKYEIIAPAVRLISQFQKSIGDPTVTKAPTPKWLAPLILLVDLYEKAAITSRRKAALSEETDHIWKWFDINSGKWCGYSTQNNIIIDKAFWEGESSVRITAGRRRYVINFSGMIQLNEETSNRRPITLWLKNSKDARELLNLPGSPRNVALSSFASREELLSSRRSRIPKLTEKMEVEGEDAQAVEKDIVVLQGLDTSQVNSLIESCVKFIQMPVEPDTLHAVMRVCLRLTRNYESAMVFSHLGGVGALLKLRIASHFTGFLPLANLLIRHCMEDPSCLRFAIEKMIREKACAPCASTCKELHYLLRVLAPVACRNPELFVEVAKDVLRVDIAFVTRRGIQVEEDRRLIVKPTASKNENFKTHMSVGSQDVIHRLLMVLAERYDVEYEEDCTKPSKPDSVPVVKCYRTGGPPVSGAQGSTTAPRSDLIDPFEQMDLDSSSSTSANAKSAKNEANEKNKYTAPLIPKYAILQLLAESVHSYSYSCKIIAEYCFQGGKYESIPEDCTALAFLLDRLGPPNQFLGNKDCNTILRDLVAAMAGCNHMPETQAIVITEIRMALQRVLSKRESQEKHLKIQYITNLISYMIETCPNSALIQFAPVKPLHLSLNHIVRLLVRKNVVTDLARIVHHVDLTSKWVAPTLNSTLKALELISRIVNMPNQPVPGRLRLTSTKSESAQQDSVNNTHTVGTSNSEGTRAQGEETMEDADNTEHDISAAAESLDPVSEIHTQEQDTTEQDEEALEEIMDQLLERETAHADEREPALNESQNSLMDTDTTENQRVDFDGRDIALQESTDTSLTDTDSEEDEDEDEEHGEGEEDEEEDEDEDDDDEEDDEDEGSNFDHDDNQRAYEEGFLRFPPLDRDDELLMVQYGAPESETAPIFFTNNASYNFNLGLIDETLMNEHSNVGLRLNHPLLQPPMNDPPVTGTVTTRGHRAGRQRRFQYFQYINPRHPPPPAILQRLLGPSTAQDVIQLTTGQALNNHGMRDARLLVMDDQVTNRNGPSGAQGTISNFTALHWWCEEAKVLDGESMHDCIVGVKRPIVETIEEEREVVFQARLEKRKKEEEARKKNTTTAAADEESAEPAGPVPELISLSSGRRLRVNDSDSETPEAETDGAVEPNTNEESSNAEGMPQLMSEDELQQAESVAMNQEMGDGDGERLMENSEEQGDGSEASHEEALNIVGSEADIEAANAERRAIAHRLAEALTQTALEAHETLDLFEDSASETEPPAMAIESDPRGSFVIIPSSSIPEPAEEGAVGGEPTPGPSGQQNVDEFRHILGDMEIPEGVDPSFLAALPEDMRQEVIAEHLRQQRARARPAPAAEVAVPTAMDVSPEFLAALPPSIQEEVLAQQRLEQQRRTAAAGNPNEPVDAEAFFRNLQPNLRQAILADMEESQMAAIPPEFAEEAQNLRRGWENRNRQLLQERFLHGHTSSTTLSSILRNSGVRLNARYGLPNNVRAQWPTTWTRNSAVNMSNHSNVVSNKTKGKQLMDFETLSCLLVVLFLDDSKINTGRLHRVIRNLCYHGYTRHWVVRSLLSVMEKCNDGTVTTFTSTSSTNLVASSSSSSTTTLVPAHGPPKNIVELVPSWLNISLDSALGCSANVFQISKISTTNKKAGYEHRLISIHSQAVTQIARHTLDVLTNLAKSFAVQFLPHPAETDVKILNTDPNVSTADSKPRAHSSTSKTKASEGSEPVFWDFLLKLDGAISGKKGKSLAKLNPHTSSNVDPSQMPVTFEASPFGQLIKMLQFPFIRRSQMLTDKLLRLLSLISLGIPETSGYGRKVLLEDPETMVDEVYLISETHLRLIVQVITSKSCSEEGLEEATALLLNLSYGPPTTRDKLLNLLTEGVRELGSVVGSHIAGLMTELKNMFSDVVKEIKDDESQPGSSSDPDPEKVFKGKLTDRFTKETVVITSTDKSKTTCELQLPSMASLTSKTSSQAFFLRLLKVIMTLRELVRVAIKKQKQKYNVGADRAGGIGGPVMSSTVVGAPNDASGNSGASSSANDNPSTSTSHGPGTSNDSEILDKEKADLLLQLSMNEAKLLPRLSVELHLEDLWDTLSQCLLELGHTPDHHAVLVLQPAVEAFFLVHTHTIDPDEKKNNTRETRETQLAHLQQELPPVSPIPVSSNEFIPANDSDMHEAHSLSVLDSTHAGNSNLPPDTKKFLSFAETHRTVLNHILRQSTTHLADGPFSVLVDHTRVLDFDIKRRYFRTELERLDEGVRREDLAVHVRRLHVFEDSFRELHRKSAEEWKNRFYIVFEGEEGQDAGGLLREWYVIISREIFNPMYALFTISPGDRVTYMINSSSHCNSNHLFYFKFVGRVIAKAIYDNKLLECYFTRSFYKHILGKYVKHGDMESEDYTFFQGLAFLMDHHISELGYDLTFSTEVQEFGVTEVRDLITNGRNIPVTEENKMEYVRLVCQMKMTGAIRQQLNSFLEGFYDIIPKRLISIFNEQELELLVSGLPNIDIEDLKANTEYHKYQATSLQIQWFWRALRSFDQADRAKFLQFVTGTSKVPLQGFGSLEGMNGVQKFQIHRDDRATDRLPSAHTCFNQLDLPAYETYDKLRTYMLKAIHECSEGFGFA